MRILKPKCYRETDLSKLRKGVKGKACLGQIGSDSILIVRNKRQCFDVSQKCKKCKHFLENKKMH